MNKRQHKKRMKKLVEKLAKMPLDELHARGDIEFLSPLKYLQKYFPANAQPEAYQKLAMERIVTAISKRLLTVTTPPARKWFALGKENK